VVSEGNPARSIAVVIPVYRGEETLRAVVDELWETLSEFETPGGVKARIAEVLLVNDDGPDRSDVVIRELEAKYPQVRGVWLSRNFGQHPATFAGMAASGSEWIVTMDEDGQHDPADIPAMLDTAIDQRLHLVYGAPANKPPHGFLRTASSRLAKSILALLVGDARNDPRQFQSFRLVRADIARSVAAFAGAGVYLDIAFGWVTNKVGSSPVSLRPERRGESGYSYRSLAGHFWRMVLTSGTRGLRVVSILGVLFAVVGIIVAIVLFVQRSTGGDLPAGWTSLVVVALLSSGAILFSLGIIAEYLGVAVNMAMGKPLYVVIDDPAHEED
jgi:undecaprenyl-phosphate 4-deoxy-4-formamido-L-arabinose transferase